MSTTQLGNMKMRILKVPQVGVILYKSGNWILLDSQSTANVFCNRKMQSNIHDEKRDLKLHLNAGTASVTKKRDIKYCLVSSQWDCKHSVPNQC